MVHVQQWQARHRANRRARPGYVQQSRSHVEVGASCLKFPGEIAEPHFGQVAVGNDRHRIRVQLGDGSGDRLHTPDHWDTGYLGEHGPLVQASTHNDRP